MTSEEISQSEFDYSRATHLPGEIWLDIFSHLDAISLFAACLTCKQWNTLISGSGSLWKEQCHKLKDCKKYIKKDRKAGLHWKEVFRLNYSKIGLKRHWKEGRFSNPKSLTDLPERPFCHLDTDSWGEVFQWELDRT
ncbi:hypothetical protein CHS0354_032524 [Potamilus streckersoni]|uniref:F-box domain-containing protein n=1 Tax=Potamilus streckersoni TaxID=2493646 RepID=A0AAE0SQK3_9BIVA|nr:hypothetical protein CHS0354_032524 [Potamilus streckersoni]